jgi:hypothetical protein
MTADHFGGWQAAGRDLLAAPAGTRNDARAALWVRAIHRRKFEQPFPGTSRDPPGRRIRPVQKRPRNSVVIRLLWPLKFVDPLKNSVDPPSNEFVP